MLNSRNSLLLAALSAALVTTAVHADEVRLADGTVLIGRARVDGEVVRVATREGRVTIPRADVVRIRTDAELEAELERLRDLAEDRPHAWLEIARRAHHWQLSESMWRDLETGLALCGQGTAAEDRARYDSFLAGLEAEILPAHRQRAGVEVRVRELLHRVRPGVSPAKIAAAEAILGAMTDPGAETALRIRARDAASDLQRQAAVRAIERRGAPGSEGFVWRTAVFDSSAKVRTNVVRSVALSDRRDAAVDYLAAGFVSESPAVRIRTAEALGGLGGPAAVEHLIAAGPAVPAASLPGGSTRGHVAFLTQQAYVRDFDVEVAQAAFIAKPVVDVIQAGTVLDATVHAVVGYRVHILTAYRRAIRHLTGGDPGPDPSTWAEWLAKREAGTSGETTAPADR